jgi:DNA polymerase (family X)
MDLYYPRLHYKAVRLLSQSLLQSAAESVFMDITNQQVGAQLLLAGQLLEIMGENVFKIRAFYRASDIIERLAVPVTSLPEAELVRIPGIGKNIAHKIFEMRDTGTFSELETLKKDVPGPLLDLLMLDGVGPKTVNKLWKKLNVQSVDDKGTPYPGFNRIW